MAYSPNQPAEQTAFVTGATLAAGATFDSGVLDANGYSQVQTEITANKDGTILIDFCSDPAGTDVVRSLSIPYVGADGYQFFAAPAFGNYIRYRFVNGPTNQSDFYYTTKWLTTAISPQLLTTNAFIAEAMVSTLNRSMIVGQNDSGTFSNVKIDNENNLQVNASNPKTAYDELPVANYSPVIQLTFPYTVNTDLVDVVNVAGGTVTATSAGNNMAVLNTSATTASSSTVTSVNQLPFRAGQGHIARLCCFWTGTPTVADAFAGIGIGDASNGYGFLLNSSGFNISYRTNGTPFTVAQTAWNVDVMDGSGSSGMTLDETKGNTYQISYGSVFGDVNFSIENQSTGDMVLVHILKVSNTNILPTVYNPTFPLRAEVGNASGTDNLSLSVASLSGFIEGENRNESISGVLNSKGFSITKSWTTSEQHIATWRNNADVFSGSGNNKVYCKLKAISFNNDTTRSATIRIYENMTITGSPVYTDINSSTSVVSTDTAGGITAGTGKLIFEAYAEKDGKGGKFIDMSNLNIDMIPNKTYTAVGFLDSTNANPLSVSLFWIEDF
jgi:hypothetical protein